MHVLFAFFRQTKLTHEVKLNAVQGSAALEPPEQTEAQHHAKHGQGRTPHVVQAAEGRIGNKVRQLGGEGRIGNQRTDRGR